MKLLGTSDEFLQDPKAIQAELDRLEERDAELRSALEDIEHESRRCNDALERAGWRSSEAETRGSLLAESREAIVADREELQELRRRLIRTREHQLGTGHDD
jgi:predicted  nucleic acid-binding Zn-ribbon protein